MTDRSLSSGQPGQPDPDGNGGDAAIWDTIGRARRWLDEANGAAQPELSMRILKIGEEYGEAAKAWAGAIGQNPRKGVTHDPTSRCGGDRHDSPIANASPSRPAVRFRGPGYSGGRQRRTPVPAGVFGQRAGKRRRCRGPAAVVQTAAMIVSNAASNPYLKALASAAERCCCGFSPILSPRRPLTCDLPEVLIDMSARSLSSICRILSDRAGGTAPVGS